MKLHEYQAKALLMEYGVPIPEGELVTSADQTKRIVARLGGQAIVKAQIHAGGRGKVGGVKFAASPEVGESIAAELIGRRLITAQTGPQGAPVDSVLVEETVDVERELYFSLTTDGRHHRPVLIASSVGGIEIEDVAQADPSMILQEFVDPAIGFQSFQGRRLARRLDLSPMLARSFVELVGGCYRAYMDRDCSMIEINPLVVTKEGYLIALDAKVSLDDDALFRHREEAKLQDFAQDDPLEVAASKHAIAYVKLSGDVGCMVNGAGLAMATMDAIKGAGGEPADFLDVGGGASEEKVAQAITIMLSDRQVKRVLVNIFGGILRCDIAARGIIEAYSQAQRQPPLVVRMLGTNMAEGKAILERSGLPITQVATLREAAQAVLAIESLGSKQE